MCVNEANILCTSRPGVWKDLTEECDDILVIQNSKFSGFHFQLETVVSETNNKS